jgi:hypothetical protein
MGGPPRSESYTLRYAADSVLFLWLLPGDVVYRYAYKQIHEPTDPATTPGAALVSCVPSTPGRLRRWIRSDVLTNPAHPLSAARHAPRSPAPDDGT